MMRRRNASLLLLEMVLWALAATFLFPIYLLLVTSLKTPHEMAFSPLSLPLHPAWSNYLVVWTGEGGAGGTSLAASFLNSVMLTVVPVVGLIVFGAMAGYGIARAASRLSGGVMTVFTVGIVLPFQLGLIPLFTAAREAGLTDNILTLAVVYLGILMPLGVILYTGFIRALPISLEEAATVDGAGPLRVFFSIVLPQLKPVTATLVILAALAIWNDIFLPVIFLGGSEQTTLPIAIYQYKNQYTADYQIIFAGIVISSVPIIALFFALQKFFVSGLNVYQQN